MRASSHRRLPGGFTLVETLVALAVLAAVAGALIALQVGAVRAQRAAERLHAAAGLLAGELVLQRTEAAAGTGACRSAPAAAEASLDCEVERSCLVARDGGCELVLVEVRVGAARDGAGGGGGVAPLTARTVVAPWLEGRP